MLPGEPQLGLMRHLLEHRQGGSAGCGHGASIAAGVGKSPERRPPTHVSTLQPFKNPSSIVSPKESAPQEEWPALVVVPAAMRLVWAEELERWLPALRPAHLHIVESKVDRLQVGR